MGYRQVRDKKGYSKGLKKFSGGGGGWWSEIEYSVCPIPF